MKRKVFIKCIIVVFLLFLSIVSVCEQLQKDISDGVVRLHIVANSESVHDQNVKLKVRDAVIDAQSEIFVDGIKKELTNEEKKKLLDVTIQVLNKEEVGYGAKVETGKFYFPTKKYENITLPAGNYDAVKVVLGNAEGQNWWCVMYPPLCFTKSAVGQADEKSLNILKESLTEFEYEIISQESIKTVPAFKLVETWQKIKEKLKNSL